jgi:hypothetical protein
MSGSGTAVIIPPGTNTGAAAGVPAAMGNAAFLPRGVPTMEQLLAWYSVNRKGWEAVRQSEYDSNAYAAAGVNSLAFFQVPQGSGTGFGGAAKTPSDTSMVLSGQLPAQQEFVVESISVEFWPTTPTVAAQMPAAYGAAAIAQIINDAYIFTRSGNLTFFIGSKNYVVEGPMNKFPSMTNFHLDAALSDATTAAASSQSRIAYGYSVGKPYMLSPLKILLISNQNFNVTLWWPEGAQAITNPARVFVRLQGMLFRASQ